MALTLDATLAAAQDSSSRHSLVEVISSSTVADIPFDGQAFTAANSAEPQPFVLNHSSGITCLIYATTACLKFAYTDSTATQFTIAPDFPLEMGITGISAVELANGNIGITYFKGTYELRYQIVTKNGVSVTAATLIASWGDSTSHTWVVRDGGTYSLFYAKGPAGVWNIYKRTSSDFATWSAETAITLTGLDTAKRVFSPSVTVMANGDWWMAFDYVSYVSESGISISNIYYAVSTDKGATWGTPIALSTNTDISKSYSHPVTLQKTATDVIMAYTKEQGVLKVNSDNGSYGIWMDRNATTGKLYAIQNDVRILEIDAATWAITRTWSHGTTPAFDAAITSNSPTMGGQFSYTGSANYHAMCNDRQLNVLNSDTNTITGYHFWDDAAYGITVNINWVGATYEPCNIRGIHIDEANMRMYVVQRSDGRYFLGYIDLNETGPMYNYTVLVAAGGANHALMWFEVYPEDDYIIHAVNEHLTVYSLSTGSIYKQYEGRGVTVSFPYWGPNSAFYYESGVVYMGFTYEPLYGQVDRRGLCRIDITTDEITYIRPTYAQIDDYAFRSIGKGAGNSLVISTASNYGLVIFDTVQMSWRYINQTTMPQLPTNNFTGRPIYNSLADSIYIMNSTYTVAIPWVGTFKSSSYFTANYSGTAWNFTDQGAMVAGYADYDAVSVLNPANTAIQETFWNRRNADGTYTLMWDTAAPAMDLSGYVVLDNDVVISRDIENTPNSFSCTFSHGYLFDPHNKTSLYSNVLKKGRKLTVRWGEKISGVDYWQDAGVFYVTQVQTAYEKGVYTDIKVTAEDIRRIWYDKHLYATDFYTEQYPETALADILTKNTALTSGDIAIPTLANRVALTHQWVDTTLHDIIEQICDRFGYFSRMDATNKFTLKRLTDTAAIDHIYPDSTKIIHFTPEDSYSDFTNRVTVQGQSKDYIEVTYAEERVGDLRGTIGFWGGNKNFDIYYSTDKSRTCINPRLKVVETSTSIAFELAGKISEYISFEDPNRHYCTVKIDAPNLIPHLIAAMEAYAALYMSADVVQVTTSTGQGFTIRVGTWQQSAAGLIIMMILASVGSYQYEVWAQPTGRVRRSLQAVADDTNHQADIGYVVEKKLEDQLCYAPADCAIVANFELMVARLQRQRVKFGKIAHLQDEEGDIIQINHPYSGQTMKVLIVKLTRSYRKASSPDGDGGFYDEIEGWVI